MPLDIPVDRWIVVPGGPLLIAFVGLALHRRRPRTGRLFLLLGLLSLYLASTPLVSTRLLASLETTPLWTADAHDTSSRAAIIVLGGDVAARAPEYGGPTVGPLSLERLRYAARLHRETALPLLVTGGPISDTPAIAALMARTLREDFGVEARWIEPRARTTWENAHEAASILREADVEVAYVVTHAWHMPRALESFAAARFPARSAPTGHTRLANAHVGNAFPSSRALRQSGLATHEWIGRWWYFFLALRAD